MSHLKLVDDPIACVGLYRCLLETCARRVFEKNIPAITYEAGKQYNYILTISGSEVDLTLKIADWNLLDSSYDIVL